MNSVILSSETGPHVGGRLARRHARRRPAAHFGGIVSSWVRCVRTAR